MGRRPRCQTGRHNCCEPGRPATNSRSPIPLRHRRKLIRSRWGNSPANPRNCAQPRLGTCHWGAAWIGPPAPTISQTALIPPAPDPSRCAPPRTATAAPKARPPLKSHPMYAAPQVMAFGPFIHVSQKPSNAKPAVLRPATGCNPAANWGEIAATKAKLGQPAAVKGIEWPI